MKRLLNRVSSSIVYRAIENTIHDAVLSQVAEPPQKQKTPVLSHWGLDSVVAQGRVEWLEK